MKRKLLFLALLILITAAFSLAFTYKNSSNDNEPKLCHANGTAMNGECLPEGICAGPTDAPIKCPDNQ